MGARDLLDDLHSAGVTVTADGDRLVIRPASKLTDDMRAALRAAKAELLAELGARQAPSAAPLRRFRLVPANADRCHSPAWDDTEIATFVARHTRLLALGFSDGDADDLAERLVLRDRDGDTRRLCVECCNFRGGLCRQPKLAGVSAEVGQMAFVSQRCSAFGPIGGER